jgi:hypothetical protein
LANGRMDKPPMHQILDYPCNQRFGAHESSFPILNEEAVLGALSAGLMTSFDCENCELA